MQYVAIDPTEERIAAGDVSGRILIWNAFAHKVPKLQKHSTQQTATQQPASHPATHATAPPAPQHTADTEMPQAPAADTAKGKASGSDTDSEAEHDQAAATAAAASTAVLETKQAAKASDSVTAPHDRARQVEEQPQQSVVQSRESAGARFARLRQSVESVPLTTVHWHAHPVGALCFSADGTLLLSGGEEAVLVGYISSLHLLYHFACRCVASKQCQLA